MSNPSVIFIIAFTVITGLFTILMFVDNQHKKERHTNYSADVPKVDINIIP